MTVLFCKQKLFNRLLITHDHPLGKHCISSDQLTLPQGKINWCQTWLGNTQGVRFSQLAMCIPPSSADIFTHLYWEFIPRYNGVAVYSCLHLNLPITWSLQIVHMTKSLVFLNEETHSLEREVTKKYLYFVKPIWFCALLCLVAKDINNCNTCEL